MCKIIHVITMSAQNGYSSFPKLVRASKSAMQLKCELINGKVLIDYEFCGDFLTLCFENNKYLIVSPGGRSINWDIVTIKPTNKYAIKNQKTYLVYRNAGKVIWDWKNVLDGFVGKKVAISPSDQYLFIFSRDRVEYMITYVVDKNNPENKLLTINES